MATTHINSEKENISNIVLMPGDPKRSKFIADNYLENPVLVNDIRGVQGYTGTYRGKKITVMASGMGNASMGLYSYELFKVYDIDTIIRVGTSGALKENINLKDIVIGNKVLTNTNYDQMMQRNIHEVQASESLLKVAKDVAGNKDGNYLFGDIYNTDTFYEDQDQDYFMNKGALVVEMEAAALYENAKKFNKNALSIFTVTDNVINDTHLSAKDREINTRKMIDFAFEIVEKII